MTSTTYTKQTWHDSPVHDTPVSAARLGHLEDGIDAAHSLAAASKSGLLTVAASNTAAAQKAHADYICDGTADEVEINTALAALTNGGTVVLLPGVYTLASPILVTKHTTTLQGSGVGWIAGSSQDSENHVYGTRIEVGVGFTGSAAVLVQSTANTSPVASVTVRDLVIEGNARGTLVDGVLFRAHSSRLHNVTIHGMTGNGVHCLGYAIWDCYDTVLFNLNVSFCTGAGVYWDTNAPDQHAVACVLFNNAYGFRIANGSEQITNCHTYSNTINVLFDNNGSRTKIVNLKCEQAAQHGIMFDNTSLGTSDVMIVGCNFKDNGHSADNTYDHIYFSNASASAHTRTSIVGCNFSYTSGNKPRYCINMPSSAVQNSNIVGNSFAGTTSVGTAALNVVNTATPNFGSNSFGSSATGRSEQRGIAAVADGGTITIALARPPLWYSVCATVAGHIASVTAVTATSLTIALKTDAGAAVAVAENVTFHATI